ncbi:MAG TPA: hydrogenase expression/formation protein HypE [bacterium]|nr:hydrogenase expression/formation protein HypE [bacterium]
MIKDRVDINVGAGGKQMQDFISKIIVSELGNSILNIMDDSARLLSEKDRIAFTSDSYVVSPVFFNGGDIGRLCVCGTVNDLASSGAVAKYLSLSFIIEAGAPLEDIKRIISSIALTAKEADISIVTGDTKVVEPGKCDVLYINTAGIGFIDNGVEISSHNAKDGDIVMVTGPIGDHEACIIMSRGILKIGLEVKSDLAPLNKKVQELLSLTKDINVIKDPTRGGLAGALNDIVSNSSVTANIIEKNVPFSDEVKTLCDVAGFDPFYLASEGRLVIVGKPSIEGAVMKVFGPKAKNIGNIKKGTKDVLLSTNIGGLRKLRTMDGIQVPRIC